MIAQWPAPGVTFSPADGVDLIYGSYEDYQNYINPPTTTTPTTTTPTTTTTTTTEDDGGEGGGG